MAEWEDAPSSKTGNWEDAPATKVKESWYDAGRHEAVAGLREVGGAKSFSDVNRGVGEFISGTVEQTAGTPAEMLRAVGKEFSQGAETSQKARQALIKDVSEGKMLSAAGDVGKYAIGVGQSALSPYTGAVQDVAINRPVEATLPQDTLWGKTATRFIEDAAGVFGPAPAGRLAKVMGEAVAGSPLVEVAKKIPGAAAETAKEAPGSLAAMLGKASELKPTEAATKAFDAGYTLPPNMATADKLNKVAGLLSGESGKHKLWQAASEMNQSITNGMSAKALGLPENAPITAQSLETVRQQVGQTRQAIQNILPEMDTSGEFAKEIKSVTGASASLQKAFPKLTATNPRIIELQNELLRHPSISASNAIELTRRLRADATRNFKNRVDPDIQALAVAQLRASDAIENLVERSISTAPAKLSSDLKAIRSEQKKLIEALDSDRLRFWKTQTSLKAQFGEGIDTPGAKHSLAMIRDKENRLSELAAKEKDTLAKTSRISDLKQRDQFLEQYREARRKAAMSYDIEAALNPSTGDISAKRLAALQAAGRPLTGELKTIADTYNAFSPAMQDVARFGGVEDWSVLDTTAALTAAAHGKPFLAAGFLARPAARATVLSKPFQRAMMGRGEGPKAVLDDLGGTENASGGLTINAPGHNE